MPNKNTPTMHSKKTFKRLLLIFLLCKFALINYAHGQSKIETLKSSLGEIQNKLEANTVIAIYQQGQEPFQINSKKYTNSNQFMIGSVSKHMTTYMLLLTLQHHFPGRNLEHLLKSNLRQLLPNSILLKKINKSWVGKICLLDLLTHRSGLSDYMAPYYRKDLTNQIDLNKPIQPVSLLKKVEFNKNKNYLYSNTNYFLISKLIEEISGQTYEQIFNQYIKGKAQLNSTYAPARGNYHQLIKKRTLKQLAPNLNSDIFIDIANSSGAGGIISNKQDLNKWLHYLTNKAPKRIFKIMTKTYGKDEDDDDINLGLFTTATTLGDITNHQGRIDSYRSFIGFNKANKLFLIVLTNSSKDGKIVFNTLNEALSLDDDN